MPEAGAVLKFPGGKSPKKSEASQAAPPPPVMDAYQYEDTVELYTIAVSVKRKGEDIISLIDEDREAARKLDIEVLGVQIRSILEGEKLTRVIDALEDSVYRKVPCSLTREGVDKVHRLERLVSDADVIMIKRMSGHRGETAVALNGAIPARSPVDSGFWIPLVIVGVSGIIGVIALIALTQSKQSNQLGQSIQPIQPIKPSKLKKSNRKAQSR